MTGAGVAQQLIAEIRRQSGLSQAELARRAGLTGSVISAYARGRRQPGVDALGRIAAGAGLQISVGPPSAEAAVGGLASATPSGRSGGGTPSLQRSRAAWARGAAEGKQLDRQRARRMSPEQRIAEGLALVRIGEGLQAADGGE